MGARIIHISGSDGKISAITSSSTRANEILQHFILGFSIEEGSSDQPVCLMQCVGIERRGGYQIVTRVGQM